MQMSIMSIQLIITKCHNEYLLISHKSSTMMAISTRVIYIKLVGKRLDSKKDVCSNELTCSKDR